MAKIPGWAYGAVGILIAVYSKFISSRSEGGNTVMSIFFWVGILLLAIGVFKTVVNYLTGENKMKKARNVNRDAGGRPVHARDFLVCPRCNAKLHGQSKYCNWCGTEQ